MTSDELERAEHLARKMNPVFAGMWSFMWPKGHCAVASLCLAPLLRASLDIDFRVVVGRADDNKVHAWIESPEGDIIDPTYGQFDSGYPVYVIDVRQVVDHMGELKLTLDEEDYYRRSISPKHWSSGWSALSDIKKLFCDYPQIRKEDQNGSRT